MRKFLPVLLVVLCLGTQCFGECTIFPADLRCERMVNPLGVDYQQPRLSWISKASDPSLRGLKQTAYSVLVASSSNLLAKNKGDLWTSGKVASGNSIAVLYRGKPLASRQRVYWKVRVWDANGVPSAWSAPMEWTAGIMKAGDWRGQWIASDLELMPFQKELKTIPDPGRVPNYCGILWGLGGKIREMSKDVNEAPAVYMRREFDAPKNIRRATAFVSGLGCFELYMNGEFVGPNLLDPAMCDYQKRVPYVVRDVTKALKQGRNAVGVVLGNGWFNPITQLFHGYYRSQFISPPQLRFDLEIEFTDGSRTMIGSSPQWKFTTDGPIRYNCFAGGETYDARKEMPGWSAPGFDDSSWKSAKTVSAPAGNMSAMVLYPVKVLEDMPAVKVEKVGDDKWRFTLKENIGGVPQLKVRAKPGQVITMDSLGAGGHTYGRYQKDIYIAKGGSEETWRPRLTYHGTGTVDVSGLGYEPKVGDLVGVVTATDMPVVGGFSCSDERLNQLQHVFNRTVYNYIIQLPNDPVREKSAWVQDVWNQFPAESWFYDVGPTYRKWQLDFLDGQFPDGYVAPVVPGRFEGPDINGPWWGGAIVYTPWLYYQTYGDASLLAESYEGMKKHFAYLEQLCVNEAVRKQWGYNGPSGKDVLWWGLGDWLAVENPRARVVFTSTAALSWFAQILADTAEILGMKSESEYYRQRAKETKGTFNATFLNAETGMYDLKGGQTAQALPLALGLVPENDKQKVEARLAKSVEEANNHIASGFVGTPILLTTLSDVGRPDLAWTVATQPDKPGFFGTVNQGTYMESWDGGGVQMPSLAAPIHCWFMEDLAGIRPESAGLRRLALKPDLVGGLTWVKAWHDGPNGRIGSSWSLKGSVFRWEVVIPANTTAEIHVPAKDAESVKESGRSAKQARGLKYLRFGDGFAVFEAGSGKYVFESVR